MPNVYFYGYGSDILSVVEAAFAVEGCRIFEAYSEPDEYLREFRSANDVERSLFADTPDDQWLPGCYLAIWPVMANRNIVVDTYALHPTAFKGKTWRQRVVGWGVIFLHAGAIRKNRLDCSTVGVNSEARARGRESIYFNEMGPVSAWNWPLVMKAHRRLGYVIGNKIAIAKKGGRHLLPEANRLLSEKKIAGLGG